MSTTVKKLVHQFTISDYDLRSAIDSEVQEWKHTEKGTWVLEHCIGNPTIHQIYNQDFADADVCVTFLITATLSENDALYFTLRWA